MSSGTGVGCLSSTVTSCCCLKIYDRDAAVHQILSETTDPDGPSLLARLCWCQCAPIPRKDAGIKDIEAISAFAGVTLQSGSHATAGSLETLRWGDYDAATRTLRTTGFGGWYQPYNTGTWTEPINPIWCFLLTLGRIGNATYEFKFSEDFQRADIIGRGNLLVFCCCCCPCIPPWFSLPECLIKNYMVQADSSVRGDHFECYSGFCGQEPRYYYDLLAVYTIDGQGTRWTRLVDELAPAQVMMTI